MKWIGQNIYDFIARFRNDVFLESISSGTIASGGHLGLDSNNKIVKAAVASGSGDIEGVTAGTGLSGGGTTGTVTLNVSGLTISEFAGASLITSSESFADNDTTLMTSAAINDRIESFGYTTNTGDITGVTITADDSNVASDTSGSADFTLTGQGGITTAVSGTTVRIAMASASTSAVGSVELATTAETTTGTDTTRAVTPDGLKDGYQGSTNVTTLGTIATGTWRGTAIEVESQEHLMHYRFMGYGTGDGSNYFLGQPFTDAQAPFEHADSSSADGTTIPAGSGTNISELIRSGGYVMPNACTLRRWKGWATQNGSGTGKIGIFKWTPADNDNTNITPVLLDEVTITAAGNDKARSFDETSFTQASVAAGDIIFTQLFPASSKTLYFNSTLEVQF